MAIKAKNRVRHDGKLYLPNETITDTKLGDALLGAGLAFEVDGVEPDSRDPDDELDRVLKVAEAISTLDKSEWTKEGNPQIEALSKAVGFKVDADLRAKAMESIKQ